MVEAFIDANMITNGAKYMFVGTPFLPYTEAAAAAAWGVWAIAFIVYITFMMIFSQQKAAWAGLYIWGTTMIVLWWLFGTTAVLQIGLSGLMLTTNAVMSKRNLQKL